MIAFMMYLWLSCFLQLFTIALPLQPANVPVEKHLAGTALSLIYETDLPAVYPAAWPITGRVTDKNGVALQGVTILIKGTKVGTSTDSSGNYTLNAPDKPGRLVVSFVGFTSRELPFSGAGTYNVSLSEDSKGLEEVVILGYGETAARRDIIGATSSIKAKDIADVPVTSVDALLQGRASGVQVIQNTGEPGGGVSVRIRGTNSIGAGNDPLYVIDGVPISTDDLSGISKGLSGSGTNPLSDINPADIESIEVLKDASATSIYGARAANGVVLITTKKGKVGKPVINFSTTQGISKLKRIQLLSSRELVELFYDQAINANQELPDFLQDTTALFATNTDWQKELFRNATWQNYDLSIRGGNDKLRYSFSSGYLKENGILIKTGFNRISNRITVDYDVSKKLKIGNNFYFSRSDRDGVQSDNNTDAVLGNALRKLPFMPVYNPNSPSEYNFTQGANGTGTINPVAVANEVKIANAVNRLTQMFYAQYEIMKGLSFRTQLSADFTAQRDSKFQGGRATQTGGRSASSSSTQAFVFTNINTLNFNRTFNKRHSVFALIGTDIQDRTVDRTFSSSSGHASDDIQTVNGGPILEQATSTRVGSGLISVLSKFSYDFDKKYYVSAGLRNDASSKFGKENRNALFPNAAIGWRILSEPFMKGFSFLSELKLRASAGFTGNQDIGDYANRGSFESGRNYAGQGGIESVRVENRFLSWEKTANYNVGLDVNFFNDRIRFTAEAYLKNTRDLLSDRPLPQIYGIGFQYENIGEVENKGLEFDLHTKNLEGAFTWNTSFNIGFNQNRIVKLARNNGRSWGAGVNDLFGGGTIISILREGEPIGVFTGSRHVKVLATDDENVEGVRIGGELLRAGDVLLVDLDGDNSVIYPEDYYFAAGYAQPLFSAGLTNNLSYKGIDLNVFMQSTYGNDVYNFGKSIMEDMDSYSQASRATLRRWRGTGQQTDMPIARQNYNNGKATTRYIEDASYLRIKALTLGYSIPQPLLKRFKIRSIRLYGTAQNLYTLTNYTGWDPEVNANSRSPGNAGIDFGSYPQPRKFIFGLNAGF